MDNKKLQKLLEKFNEEIAGLNLNWKEKVAPKGIDYEEYVLPREKRIIKDLAKKIQAL